MAKRDSKGSSDTVTIEHEGKKYVGRYTLSAGRDPKLTVTCAEIPGGIKRSQLGASNVEDLARTLLSRLVSGK